MNGKSKDYKVAIIGLGRMASTIDDELPGWKNLPYSIAAACRASPRLDVVAGSDLLPERREAFTRRWGVQALYEDYREMIQKERPDLVAITTRAENHAELAVAVANMGVKMIYCEKAMACSMHEADAVLEACRTNGVCFNTGVLRRFDRQYAKMREVIASGEIGEPRAALYCAPRSTLMHIHVHSIDTIMYLLGDPAPLAVRGQLRPNETAIHNGRLDFDPDATYHMEFAGGTEAFVVPAGTLDYEVIGTLGSVRAENNGGNMRLRRKADLGTKWASWAEMEFPAVDPGESPTARVLADIVDAYETGRPTLGNVEVCHQVTEACLAVAESHRQGSVRIELPLQNRNLYIWHV